MDWPRITLLGVYRGYFKGEDGQVHRSHYFSWSTLSAPVRSQEKWVVYLCCGSGSGCIAALRMGYIAFGVDAAPDQVQVARKRLDVSVTSKQQHM